MSAKRGSKVLCQKTVPYELYMGLTFTAIWLETIVFKRKCRRGCKKTALRKASVHESVQMPFFLTNSVENSEN